ncbi:MAG: D-alanyl-D-alanine carboxypeptidase family protein [Microcystis flos-aquae DF17]|jgi:D-alanyl-D-alanine carboxypeptidase|uniref:Genome sequencing data, contig C320 n=2 Tax=Microcystis TaxID=1125 RepID=I4FQF8_MICAE|nr:MULTISPECIES: M15 family metallopeptidase [Microcystis]MCZ8274833.1 M15 family metallopeptidase [Microcystis sp. LE19-4.1E]MCZ8364916.1 M15 family metallopeptidase [Microcystis sp. LE19-251.1A]REJ42139.1 MAG: D-alanyl-D-alanine carboxypeptidase family protein [Microcystis flos-aquae DF17]MCZ8027756.1 M15 family metallopeptidase [Microcystis sp. LE19-10.1B]MCZ8064552.1 M15 family metallopeptidase [Microcystis sp. LE17-20D]
MKKLIVALPIILIVIGIALNSYAVLHFFSQKTPQLISTPQTRPITSSQSPTPILPSPPTIINSPTSLVNPSPKIPIQIAVNQTKLGHLPYQEGDSQQMMIIASYAQDEYQRFERIAPETALALMKLIYAAREDRVWIIPVSGFRTIAHQDQLWQSQIQRQGSPEAAAKISAPPGYSEHHTGYALDLTDGNLKARDDITYKFAETDAFKWLTLHAKEFGFELSFPKNNSQGVSYEPWHWRFVGSATAQEIFRVAKTQRQ